MKIQYPDGDWSVGKSWRELEGAMRAREYETFETRHDFRSEMRKRAFLASGTKIPMGLTSHQFMLALAKAGLFQIKEENWHHSTKSVSTAAETL
jgi:hypothetical protein